MNFKKHKRKGALSELIKASEFILNGGDLEKVSISDPDKNLDQETFSQGYIARNPDNHNDKWYISKEYYDKNLEPLTEAQPPKEETFLDRLQIERDQLNEKATKLEAFLANKEKALEISGQVQYDLLLKQIKPMKSYLKILDERLFALQID
jgi:hypothetical protein